MSKDDQGIDSSLAYYAEVNPKKGKSREQTAPGAAAEEVQEFKIIGKRTPRIDGERIVTGRAKYTHDIVLEDMLFGKVLRSPHASAEIVSMDLSAAKAFPGVRAVLQLKEGRVRWAGEQVAAVAAVDEDTATEALSLIKVEYKVLPHVVTPDKASEEGAPQVQDNPNVQKLDDYSRGDVEMGFKEADVILERTYRTAAEIHHPVETHASIAKWDDDRLIVYDSTQGIFSVRDGLARSLNMPASKVRVIKQYMGGGFGSKLSLSDFTVAAAELARLAGKPVKIMLTRRENAMCVGFRPVNIMTVKAGAKKDGTLTAISLKNMTGGGVGRGDGVAEPFVDLYACPNIRTEEFSIFSNTCSSRPTRAPGHTQGIFALEGFMEELAAELGLDPLEIRQKNYTMKSEGTNGVPYSTKGLDQCYKLGAEKIGWSRRNKKPGEGQGKIRRGIGMASQIWWGAGVPGTLAVIKVYRDGSIEAVCGTQDLGTGTRTYMAVIAAETLGLEPRDIAVRLGDTEYPWAPSSGGSQTTPSVAPAVRDAALKAAEFLKKTAAEKLNCRAEDMVLENKKIIDKTSPERSIAISDLAKTMPREAVFHGVRSEMPETFAFNTFGAQFAEVEVDIETGRITVKKVVAAHEVGRIINLQTAESQVAGGITQGLSAALFEERVLDETTGRSVNPNLHDYKIATSMDIPEIVPIFVPMTDPRINNLGNKGLGEPPRIPASAVIANAVYNAIGVHPGEIPMTPARVLDALRRKEQKA